MSIKWEIGALAGVLALAAGFMWIAEPVGTDRALERTDNFSQLDYDAFDRNFQINGKTCPVGIAKHRLCFSPSPLETQITKGESLNAHIPMLAAEFPILVATPPKAEHQKLLRYGKTLVLLNEETRIVEDVLGLDNV